MPTGDAEKFMIFGKAVKFTSIRRRIFCIECEVWFIALGGHPKVGYSGETTPFLTELG
jgi:hypothetical protein